MYPWVPNHCHFRASSECPPADAQGVRSMGRGRQKAKHTKVARDLKYYSPPTDLTALQRELQGKKHESDGDDWAEDSHEWADEDARSEERRVGKGSGGRAWRGAPEAT